MDWKSISGMVLGLAPTIGTMLGGPLGGIAGKVLADALGTDPTPEAVGKAITEGGEEATAKITQAEAEAAVKWPALAQMAQSEADVGKAQVESVNATIQVEAAQANNWWGAWRTQLAQMLVLECPVWVGLIVWAITTSHANEVLILQSMITTWWTARFGVLGVHIWTGSNERKTAMTGEKSGGLIADLIKSAINRKK